MAAAHRLQSIDALRGFDMFWIIGADYVVHYLFAWTGADVLGSLSTQLRHADWVGVRAYDIVFPLFMFLSGASLGVVGARDADAVSRRDRIARAGRRALALALLGVVYNWGWNVDWAQTRVASVLGLIGGSYFAAAVVTTTLPGARARLGVAVALLVVVAALQLLAPVPGVGAGVLTPDGAVNGWIDRALLPGRLHGGVYDPEGLLAILSGAAITISGAVAGSRLARRSAVGAPFGLRTVALVGAALILAGLSLAPAYPPIKKLWTVTFVLISIGASLLALCAGVLLIDVWRLRRVGAFFAVIGANAILAYFLARYFVYPLYKIAAAQDWSAITSAGVVAAAVAAQWVVLWALYRKRIFLRV